MTQQIPKGSGGSGSGEANTASNVGAGGVGLYKQKTGVNLEFKNINAGSSKVSVANDAGNSEVDIDVVEANLNLANIGGTLGTGQLDGGAASPGNSKYYGTDGSGAKGFYAVPGGGAGEANTASNVGTGGVGVYKQKTGVNLEFKNINAGSSKISVTNDAGNNEVDVDAVEANFNLANIGGTLGTNQMAGGSGSPGNSKYYGTDGSGTKGFFDLPSGGSSSAFRARRTTTQSAIVTATYTKVQLATEDFDTNANFDPVTNFRFTPTISGKYRLSAIIELDNMGDRQVLRAAIYKNGSLEYEDFVQTSTTGATAKVNVNILVDANGSTDYFELYVHHNVGSNRDLLSALFCGEKVA